MVKDGGLKLIQIQDNGSGIRVHNISFVIFPNLDFFLCIVERRYDDRL